VLQHHHHSVGRLGFLPADGSQVYCSFYFYGSPAEKYSLRPRRWITSLNVSSVVGVGGFGWDPLMARLFLSRNSEGGIGARSRPGYSHPRPRLAQGCRAAAGRWAAAAPHDGGPAGGWGQAVVRWWRLRPRGGAAPSGRSGAGVVLVSWAGCVCQLGGTHGWRRPPCQGRPHSATLKLDVRYWPTMELRPQPAEEEGGLPGWTCELCHHGA
jgi:hypothetical protein